MLPDRNPLFVTLSDGSIRNGYTLKILNMLTDAAAVSRSRSSGLPGAGMWLAGADETAGADALMVEVEPDRLKEIKVFVSQPREAVEGGSTRFHFKITDQSHCRLGKRGDRVLRSQRGAPKRAGYRGMTSTRHEARTGDREFTGWHMLAVVCAFFGSRSSSSTS